MARGRPPGFDPISAAFGRLPHIVAVLYVVAVLTSAGSLLCLVPGWIAGFSLILSGYVAADSNLGVVDSLRYASRLMVGHRVQYVGLSLLVGIVGGLGTLLTCGLGVLPLLALGCLMSAIAYVRLSGRVTAGMPDPSL